VYFLLEVESVLACERLWVQPPTTFKINNLKLNPNPRELI
jgi:hypothetical protein